MTISKTDDSDERQAVHDLLKALEYGTRKEERRIQTS